MLSIKSIKHPETGRDMIIVEAHIQEVMEPLQLLRGLKAQYPALWQQVTMELHLPPGVAQAADKIVGVNGD